MAHGKAAERGGAATGGGGELGSPVPGPRLVLEQWGQAAVAGTHRLRAGLSERALRRCGSRGKLPSAGTVPGPRHTPLPGRKPRGRPRTVVSQQSHMGAGRGAVAPSGGLSAPGPRPWGSCHRLGKQLRKLGGNTNPPPQSLPLPLGHASAPATSRNVAQPRAGSPARLALARPTGHVLILGTPSIRACPLHLVPQRLALPQENLGIELESTPHQPPPRDL